MNISIIVVGKTIDKAYKNLVKDYTARIKRFHNISYQELNLNYKQAGNIPNIMRKIECNKILNVVDPRAKIILCDECGTEHTSVEFAQFIEKAMIQSEYYTFIIGGAYGFHQDLYDKAHLLLSLSKMTFTHQMARVVLLEQVYRAFSIIYNKPYHNN